ncbi:MAG: GtrA family protein [Zoogloeaceae bacterium]|nr:GtrA family protein [Rhodocyclaceae bacterium]MCP5234857.1 GtrA family protein [Zoogloeaceae bacterium]
MAFLRFVLVGGLGFIVDAGITLALIGGGWSAETARVPAIASAMLTTWIANRSFTFRVARRGSLRELQKYLAVALAAAGFNYLVYRMLLSWALTPLPAIVVATALQAILSFLAYRHLVFSPLVQGDGPSGDRRR